MNLSETIAEEALQENFREALRPPGNWNEPIGDKLP